MLPIRLFKYSTSVAGLQKICNITAKEFHQFALLQSSRKLPARRFAITTTFYCTQIKKNDLAIKAVDKAELLQEAIVKKKQQLQEKKIRVMRSFERSHNFYMKMIQIQPCNKQVIKVRRKCSRAA